MTFFVTPRGRMGFVTPLRFLSLAGSPQHRQAGVQILGLPGLRASNSAVLASPPALRARTGAR